MYKSVAILLAVVAVFAAVASAQYYGYGSSYGYPSYGYGSGYGSYYAASYPSYGYSTYGRGAYSPYASGYYYAK